MITIAMRVYLGLLVVFLITNLLLTCSEYPDLPNTIPTHINGKGDVDK